MATDVPMPKLGLTMEEATIVQWLVAEGDLVEADQPFVLIETDKTETEAGAPGSGRIHLVGAVGQTYRCGERIAVLLAEGEAAPSATGAPAAPAATAGAAAAPQRTAPAVAPAAPPPAVRGDGGRVLASPNARRVAAERGVPLAAVRGTGPGGRIVSEDVESAPLPVVAHAAPPALVGNPANAHAVATVSARNLADLLGVDLTRVPVDPVEQRITRDGVALHVRQRLQQVAPASTPAAPPAAPAAPSWPLLQEPTSTVRLSGMRGTIAKRMTQSLREMAQLTLSMDADMDAVLADRAERKAGRAGPVPSITDYVVAAASRALLRHPGVNAQVTEDGIALLPEVHMGLAVAVDGGLLVPVIRDAAHRDLADLAAEAARLAAAARAGSLGPKDLEGGTFSVSALGAYGVDVFTPVINPPNAGILGVGRLRDDLLLVGGEVRTTKRLTLSLTWDHRVFDGVPAAEFCRTVVQLLAEPATLA